MTDLHSVRRRLTALSAGLTLALAAGGVAAQTGDYIVAVVNQELVTAAELQQRLARVREEAIRNRQQLPSTAALRQQVLDVLIDERVLVTNARDSGAKIDESELDRAVGNVALQNQLTLPQLRDRLKKEGVDYLKFRASVKDQMMVERVREREVASRIRISEQEVDTLLAERRQDGANSQINVAQILIIVPENANEAAVAELRSKAEAALKRVTTGNENFATVAREVSQDSNKANGGEMGMRTADRLPDLFVQSIRPLKSGQVLPQLVRSGAGFHILKLVERKDEGAFSTEQTHARHILLRPSAELSAEAATKRLVQLRREITSGGKRFEQAARENSEDSSAQQGGDLGWSSPGQYVPEFEEALNSLDAGGISEPIATRFGVHLVQVIERRRVTLDPKQQREQARNILREQKFEEAYVAWLKDLRGQAYVELREPPQ